MKISALLAVAGLAASAQAQFTVVLHNSFETTVRADQNEFATASIDGTTTESLYPLNTSPLSPDPVTDANFGFIEFPAGVIFQPVAQFNANGTVGFRFDSPQTGLGIIEGNFGFVPLEVNFQSVNSNVDPLVSGLPTTGDGRGSIVTQDSVEPVPEPWASANGFGGLSALSGLNFELGDPTIETPFQLFFQDVNNFGNNGPVDFSTGPSGAPSAFFTGESTGDFIGSYPAFSLAGFLSGIQQVNTVDVPVTVTTRTFVPETDPVTGAVLFDTVVVNGANVNFPRGTVTETTTETTRVEGQIRADANFDGVIETFGDGTVENIGSQAYEFNDTDGSIILQFDAIPAAATETFQTLQLAFHWARNTTGYEDENLNFFSNDINGDGEDDLLLDTNGDGIPDGTGNQQPDSLQVYINNVLIFEAGTESRVQNTVDGATVRRLALQFGLFDTGSSNFGGVFQPDNDGDTLPDFRTFNGSPNGVPTVFSINYVPVTNAAGAVTAFLPNNQPLPRVPARTGTGAFSDENPNSWQLPFFNFVDGLDGAQDGALNAVTGPISPARFVRNINNSVNGGSVPVLSGEDFFPEVLDISDFIGEEMIVTVVGTTTAADETMVIDNITVRGSETVFAELDFNQDGAVDTNDLLAVATAIGNGSFLANFDGNGTVNFLDFLNYLTRYEAAN